MYQSMIPAKYWPTSVYVLDEHCNVSGYHCEGDYYTNPPFPAPEWPKYVNSWLDLELRLCHSTPLHILHLISDTWWSIYNKLYRFNKRPVTDASTTRLLYNTTWAYLGYTEDQDPVAVTFAAKHNTTAFQEFKCPSVLHYAPAKPYQTTYYNNPDAPPLSYYRKTHAKKVKKSAFSFFTKEALQRFKEGK